MKAKFPKAERMVQIRVFNHAGDTVTVEGPVTNEEAGLILRTAINQRTDNPEPKR